MAERLPIGGYVPTKKYGSPDYCPSATPRHMEAIREHGRAINARWFKSVREAVSANYSPCGNCWLVGDQAVTRWIEYITLCKKEKIKPMATPKRIKAKLGRK